MPDLIRHPLPVDSGSRAGVTEAPTPASRTVAVMPDLIRHPVAVDSGFRRSDGVMPTRCRHAGPDPASIASGLRLSPE
jgi:hypothetical protein